MSSHYDSPAKKEKKELYKKQEAEIIPWPDMERAFEKHEEQTKHKKLRLDQKFIYYKDRKIPIMQFQKSGYDKLLKLLIKEIER